MEQSIAIRRSNMTKQPSYRFAGYTEPWAEKKLGNLGSVEMCRRIFKEETSTEFEIPFFKIGTFGGEADTYITRVKFEEYKTKFAYPQRGDLLLSASGSIGRVVEYDGDEAYYQDSNIVWLNHHGKINNKFLKAFYEIVSWSGVEGTTIKRLYNKNILETDISLPSLPEQTAIGSFFQDIDQLISLQQCKLEALKEQKKTYLKLLFPVKGQTKPALRFAGFEDEWKEVKLGEVFEFSKGKGLPMDSFYEGEDNLAIGYGHLYTLYDEVITKVQRSSDSECSMYSNGNELLFPASSTVPFGTAKVVALLESGVKLGGDIIVASPDSKKVNNIFMSYNINSIKEKMYPITVGTTITHMYAKDLKELRYFLPNLPEQEAIASFFQDIDKAIAKQEEKVNQLKESKQTLLRKMFI